MVLFFEMVVVAFLLVRWHNHQILCTYCKFQGNATHEKGVRKARNHNIFGSVESQAAFLMNSFAPSFERRAANIPYIHACVCFCDEMASIPFLLSDGGFDLKFSLIITKNPGGRSRTESYVQSARGTGARPGKSEKSETRFSQSVQ